MEIRLAKKEEIVHVERMILKAAKLLQSRGIAQWERFLNIYNISICEEDFKRSFASISESSTERFRKK